MFETVTHTCDCKVHNGASFTAPKGRISGTPRQIKDMTHNYLAMAQSPVFGPRLASEGIVAVQS